MKLQATLKDGLGAVPLEKSLVLSKRAAAIFITKKGLPAQYEVDQVFVTLFVSWYIAAEYLQANAEEKCLKRTVSIPFNTSFVRSPKQLQAYPILLLQILVSMEEMEKDQEEEDLQREEDEEAEAKAARAARAAFRRQKKIGEAALQDGQASPRGSQPNSPSRSPAGSGRSNSPRAGSMARGSQSPSQLRRLPSSQSPAAVSRSGSFSGSFRFSRVGSGKSGRGTPRSGSRSPRGSAWDGDEYAMKAAIEQEVAAAVAADAAAGECVGLVLDFPYGGLADAGALGRFQAALREDVAWATGTEKALVEMVGGKEYMLDTY